MPKTQIQKPVGQLDTQNLSASKFNLPPRFLKERPLTFAEQLLSDILFQSRDEFVTIDEDKSKKSPNWIHRG